MSRTLFACAIFLAACGDDAAPTADSGATDERDGGAGGRDGGSSAPDAASDPDAGGPRTPSELGPRARVQPECAEPSRCFYASPAGGGDCTEASPCTIAVATERMGGGDTLFLGDGVYTERYGETGDAIISIDKYFSFDPAPSADAPVLITAAPGAAPILDGGGGNWCVLVDGESHVIIDGLTVRNCGCAGVRVGYDAPTSNVTVRHSDFSAIHCDDNMGGVYVHGAASVVIEDNRFHDFDYARGGTTHRGLGLVIFQAIDLTIAHNEFTSLNQGLYYKHGEAETGRGGFTRIEHNVFAGLDTQGMETNQNRTEIRGNLFDGAHLSMHNEDGTRADFTFGVVVEDNTFVRAGISMQHGSEFSGAHDVTIRRNVLYDSFVAAWTYGSDAEYGEGVGLVEEGDCVFREGEPFEFDYFSSDNPAYGGETTGGLYSLAEWQAMGFGAGTIEADPMFAGPTDYRPSSGSPCAAMGAFAAAE